MSDNPGDLSPLLQLVQAFQDAVLRHDEAAIRRLVNAYGTTQRRLQGLIEALAEDIAARGMTNGKAVKLTRYKQLMEQLTQELSGLQTLTRNEIDNAVNFGLTAGERDAVRTLAAATRGDPAVLVGFNRLPVDAIRTLLGFLDPQGALYERISKLASTSAEYVTDAITEGIALGYNPIKTARLLGDAYGRGLTDAMRLLRTVQLWTYREASRASYVANADVLRGGWKWWANLDNLTCMSCVAMHGTIHPLSEPLRDHHNGRCAMIPLVKGFPDAFQGDGQGWFTSLPEAEQRRMMGAKKYDAWRSGAFSFDRLSSEALNDVYGKMRVETPLKTLVGENE